jgi:hypothetical protein
VALGWIAFFRSNLEWTELAFILHPAAAPGHGDVQAAGEDVRKV